MSRGRPSFGNVDSFSCDSLFLRNGKWKRWSRSSAEMCDLTAVCISQSPYTEVFLVGVADIVFGMWLLFKVLVWLRIRNPFFRGLKLLHDTQISFLAADVGTKSTSSVDASLSTTFESIFSAALVIQYPEHESRRSFFGETLCSCAALMPPFNAVQLGVELNLIIYQHFTARFSFAVRLVSDWLRLARHLLWNCYCWLGALAHNKTSVICVLLMWHCCLSGFSKPSTNSPYFLEILFLSFQPQCYQLWFFARTWVNGKVIDMESFCDFLCLLFALMRRSLHRLPFGIISGISN